MDPERIEFYTTQINNYREQRLIYEELTEKIKEILKFFMNKELFKEKYLVEGRVKSISSFAEKISRPNKNYIDPLNELTDLSGVRVILPTIEKEEAVCELIRRIFKIDTKNSWHKLEKLKPHEFGYLSHHFIVELDPTKKFLQDSNIEISEYLLNHKAEIQVKTYLAFAWNLNQHGYFYKGEFEPPSEFQREFHRSAALLEEADHCINNVFKKIHDYESSYGAYMSRERIEEEIERLQIVFNAVPEDINLDVGYKIAKLAMEIENWNLAINTLSSIQDTPNWQNEVKHKKAAILRDLGEAMTQFFDPIEEREQFGKGQKLIKQAILINEKDVDAIASLGGSYKRQRNHEKAYKKYQDALTDNPNEPYPLINYLIYELNRSENINKIIKYHRSAILKAIKKRSKQIGVLVAIPWAFFDVGFLSLLLGNIDEQPHNTNLYESLNNYLMGIRFSPNLWMIHTTIKTLNLMQEKFKDLKDIDLVMILLYLGIIFHSESNLVENRETLDEAINYLRNNPTLRQNSLPTNQNVIILAGGTNRAFTQELPRYGENFFNAFRGYTGVIISGGTNVGVCALAGNIQQQYPNDINLIGYIPNVLPTDGTVRRDDRYTHFITSGSDFSILEGLQYWYDIHNANIDPSKVKLIGLNGGEIANLEYLISIVFGAQVGLIEDSGRAASELIKNQWWTVRESSTLSKNTKRLFKVVPNKTEEIKNFIFKPVIFDPDVDSIKKILILQHETGTNMFELDFAGEAINNEILTALLNALDRIGDIELKVGEILSVKFREAFLTGGFVCRNRFKIIFLLKDTPSLNLEENIKKFIEELETKYCEKFNSLAHQFRVYSLDDEMRDILKKSFGEEISKLLKLQREE
jgi:ppGpp synthetase/RelA/SpoT-type nucleotidyltranferase